MSRNVGEGGDVLDELSQKLGTLEALLDNLDKKKGEQRDNVFDHGHEVNHAGFENDSLDEISSLSGLSSSLNSSIAVRATVQTNVTYEPDSLDSDSESSSRSEEVVVPVSLPFNPRPFETPPTEDSEKETDEIQVAPSSLPVKDNNEMREVRQRVRLAPVPSTIVEERGHDGSSESEETVSIRNIQFMDNADNLGDRVERFFVAPNRFMLNHGEDVLDFMAKAKEYESEIQVLQKELKEYTQVESKINTHLSKVSEWSSLEQSKRSSLRKRVEQTIANLEQQKTHIVGLEQQVERARTELEELRAPSSWLYFTIALLLIVIAYWGVDVNYPLSYV